MQIHSPIHIGNMTTVFQNLKLGHVIAIARLDEKRNEQKITEFLKATLNDNQLPYLLYAQQRHYLMMKYQESQSESFNFNIDFSKYEKNGTWLEEIEINGFVFRQLNGYECEALELYAKDYLDWLLGALALQVSGDGILQIEPCKDVEFAKRIIENRMAQINSLFIEKSELLINSFMSANDQLNHLIDISFDNDGIVCTQYGGTDDAPIRFRPLSTIPATIKSLLGGLSS